ncbi:MarR family transcriptional regulator [Streptomyces sp. M19]
MGDLAERLMVKAPHVTREVRRLEECGLVAIDREADDQRVRRATVTEDGREAVARAETTGRQWLTEALEGFSPRRSPRRRRSSGGWRWPTAPAAESRRPQPIDSRATRPRLLRTPDCLARPVGPGHRLPGSRAARLPAA